MSEPHSTLVSNSIKYLNCLKNCFAFPYTPSPYGKRSVSDIICCYHGRFCVIEIKIGKDTPTPLQRIFQRKVKETNGFSRVCWSLDEVKQFVKDVDRALKSNDRSNERNNDKSISYVGKRDIQTNEKLSSSAKSLGSY